MYKIFATELFSVLVVTQSKLATLCNVHVGIELWNQTSLNTLESFYAHDSANLVQLYPLDL
jgi:hypothetical protein